MRGFTLIESVIYIALLALLLTGAVAASYGLIGSASKTGGSNATQDEGEFVLRKIDWALNGTSSSVVITTPAVGVYSNTLALTRTDGTSVRIRKNGSAIELSRDGGVTYAPLTTSNVSVSNLQFYQVAQLGAEPGGLMASTTIGSSVFYTERYVRK